MYHFRNLIFEGGGIKGLAYVGAMEVLAEKGIVKDIKRVGGTSAGAINALLLGLNFDPAEIRQIITTLDFTNFIDDSWGLLRDSQRLINEFGWYKGEHFRNWVAALIKTKTGNSEATFADVNRLKTRLGFRDMYFIGTNLSTRFCEIFSFEHTPRMCVADAVRISMSIPLFFAAKRNLRSDVYVDGGLLDNYPIKLFDRQKYVETFARVTDYYSTHNANLVRSNKAISPYVYNQETLGFRLDSSEEIAMYRDQAEPQHNLIDDFFDFAWSLVATIMESQGDRHLHSDDWQRTIYIDTLRVNTTEFDISPERKNALITSGRQCAEKYFQWYDNKENQPINRPNDANK